ncbi:hypothetical protein ES703_29733 [subsurface metagenome]
MAGCGKSFRPDELILQQLFFCNVSANTQKAFFILIRGKLGIDLFKDNASYFRFYTKVKLSTFFLSNLPQYISDEWDLFGLNKIFYVQI